MTLLEIEAFLAVVKYGTLSTASQNLFISQPALTRRIQIMEQELGYPLFIRQKGHRDYRWLRQCRSAMTAKKSRESMSRGCCIFI